MIDFLATPLLAAGIVLGFFLCRFVLRENLAKAKDYDRLKSDLVSIETKYQIEKEAWQHQLEELKDSEERLKNAFKALSADALQQNTKVFLDLIRGDIKSQQEKSKLEWDMREKSVAKTISPIKDSLESFNEKVSALEKNRLAAYEGLKAQIANLNAMQFRLEGKTAELSKSLSDPNIRGQWGELQLRRVVEYAGMIDHVDFETQKSFDAEGRKLRPDMVINMPGNRNIIVDAKSPNIEKYLSALQSDNQEEQKNCIREYCKKIKETLKSLSSKDYALNIPGSPDFIVLFFPGEWIFSSILREEPELLELASKNNIILSAPTTLIALLKSVAYGWKQYDMAKETKEICRLGGEMYERLVSFFKHFKDLNKSLDSSVSAYNKLVSSLESRLLPSAKKFQTLSKTSNILSQPNLIENNLKSLKDNNL